MDSAVESLPPAGESEEPKNETEEEALLARAQRLIAKIVASQANPNPNVLHALASILEREEARYLEQSGTSSFSGGRGSHNIGKLGNLVRENDDFFELISSKFLSESRYSTSVRAAAARFLLSCSATLMYPHVFEDVVLENVKHWVMEDTVKVSSDEINWKLKRGRNKLTDSEMLRTYATGLLSLSLAGGGQVVEDVLTSGLSAKLMRYLRVRVLGETSSSQKDASYATEGKHAPGTTCIRSREENRSRYRQVLESTHLDNPRMGDDALLDDQGAKLDHDRNSVSFRHSDTDTSTEGVGMYETAEEDIQLMGEDRWQLGRDLRDGKSKCRSNRDEDCEETAREDSSRRKGLRIWGRIRGKGRIADSCVENERDMASSSPGSGLRLGGAGRNSMKERNPSKYSDNGRAEDGKTHLSKDDDDDGFAVEKEENDERFKDCKIGTRDISDLVKKATRAAEAEARAANAPAEAITAAGDAAAELVKTSALEALKSTNDEEAAVLAASKAASTVVEAAIATEVSRSSINVDMESEASKAVEPEKEDDLDDLIIPDEESIAQLRERYCIQCLEMLGEYVEVLGPVLHEKGVDVCLALLLPNSKHKEASDILKLLPEILKLICALAAHRKFAALFVDRGGMQKLLAVQRSSQTYTGLSLCLFTIGSLQWIMERVCALPSDVVHQVVELALQLLECPQDQARKNAAVFFASAFVFRAVLDSYDAQEGLRKMLNILHGAASVRSGNNSVALVSPSNMGTLRNDRSPAEVLTASEKQIAYHTCVALHQYFRAHLILLVDSLRPNKYHRSVARNVSARAAYKPLDISNEAIDTVFLQIQRDRKLGPALVRARWPAVDKFLASSGHITMLELCQAPPVERYLHDLAQYALGVLHIVTLVPYSRKLIVNATLSNDRVGMAVILDAANGAGYVDPEVIQPALNVLVNLVCPPPSISNKPPAIAQGQQPGSVQTLNGPSSENRERHLDRNISDRLVSLSNQSDPNSNSQTAVPTIASGVVGDRRISLGPGAGCAGLAAQLEQGYRQAREAVRANNGIKVLLHLLHPRIFTPPAALDCLRALACRVLLGLARDGTIAHILTKLQVGKKLSELIRDSGNQASSTDQGRWQAELAQVAIELIAIVTNSGRASTLAATDAAAPTLRRIERAAIAAATPITYHSRELLLLIHEHLQASGLNTAAAALLKEAQLTPLPSISVPTQVLHQTSVQETPFIQLKWPAGRVPCGFLSDARKAPQWDEIFAVRSDSKLSCSRKKPLIFSSNLSAHGKIQPSAHQSSTNKKLPSTPGVGGEAPPSSVLRPISDMEPPFKTPILLPMKRKLMEFKDNGFMTPVKRLNTADQGCQSPVSQTPIVSRKIGQPVDSIGFSITPMSNIRDPFGKSTPSFLADNPDDIQCSTPLAPVTPSAVQLGLLADPQAGNTERVTLDSLVVQYLKHQHRQCPAPITTLPPLSLLHPHVCPEPSRSLDAPTNITARLSTREFRYQYGGTHGNRRDRHFVYSRFRPWRTCRDDAALLSCITFLGDSSRIATGSHSGEIKIFESNSGNVLESHACHQSPVTLVQSGVSGTTQLILSSGTFDVRLWDASSVSVGPVHSFEGCKAARFSHSGTTFAALSTEASRREVLLYDIQSGSLDLKLSDSSNPPSGPVRGHAPSLIHFSPSDTMLLWNGVVWDRRGSGPVHRFDQFTDYGGGGFHPSGNEVIINSEVWDLRKFKLLRSVPSLDQTVIKFNSSGDVIYAILRRNLEDITSAVHTRRVRHPLFPAFRTVDAVNYSDIATIPVDRCVLDFATEPTDSFVGVVAMDDHEDMFSSARLYEIGRRRPTDDDSDPDDAETDEEDDDDDSEADEDLDLVGDLDIDGDSDQDDIMSNEDDDSGDDDDDDDGDDDDAEFNVAFENAADILEIVTEGDEDDDSQVVDSFSSDDDVDYGDNGFGF